jgi:hypothetical protein
MRGFRGGIALILAICFALHAAPVARADYGGFGDCDPGNALPGYDATKMPDTPDEMHPYEYEPLSPEVLDAQEPSPDELDRINVSDAVKGNSDTLPGMLARWKKYVNRGGAKPWDQWKPSYITVITRSCPKASCRGVRCSTYSTSPTPCRLVNGW